MSCTKFFTHSFISRSLQKGFSLVTLFIKSNRDKRKGHAMPTEFVRNKFPLNLLIIFLLLAAGIGTSGYLYYKQQRISLRNDAINDISSIAEMKANQIVIWRKERLGDAEVIYKNALINHSFQEWLKSGSLEIKKDILIWMKALQKNYQYLAVIFLDIKGNIRLAVPDGKEILGPDAKRFVQEAIHTKMIIFSRLYRSKINNVIRLTLAVPLLVSQGQDHIPIGVLLLRIDPGNLLYPLIQSWPTPSKTAETYLVRKEGNDALFLNELRHKKDTALNLRIPLDNVDNLAVMAVKGRTEIVEGKDYRDIAVIAAIKAIPNSPWFIVAKIDKKEVFAALEKNAALIGIIVSVLILASGLAVLLIWRSQQSESYRKEYEAESERKVYAQRYEHLTEHANDIILLSEKDGRIIDANERAFQTYGYDHKEEMLQLTLPDLSSAATKALLNGKLKDIEKRNGMIYETQHQKKDGTVFAIEVSCRLIEIEGREHIQSIIRDITERKEAEVKIRQLTEELEQRVLDRTAELEAANKELKAFSDSVSHDLRAPLRAITGFSQILMEDYADKLGGEGRRLLNVICSNTQKMEQLIDDLLAYSRIGRIELRFSRIDMDTSVNSIIDEIKISFPERTVHFDAGPILPAMGDRSMIHQVLMNLLSNAIKFTKSKEKAVIEIGSRGEGDKNIYYIKDNGVGFDMQYVDKLFGIFQRLHSEEQFEGTGVGLAIVQRIIHRHGGKVWAEGKENEGATFFFTLPKGRQ
jgi:PAS domain S-box-containing protein